MYGSKYYVSTSESKKRQYKIQLYNAYSKAMLHFAAAAAKRGKRFK
jgi:hypothetical protein